MRNPESQPYLFIDFEASSLLQGTFPIEIGWIGDGVPGESYLIEPSAFMGWGDWSYESQAVHGISIEQLRREGRPADWVARRFLEVLTSRQGVVGSLTYDTMWSKLLLETVGADCPTFLSDETALRQAAMGLLGDEAEARRAIRAAQEACLDDIVHHRALPDARNSFEVYRTLIELARKQASGGL